MGGVSADNLDTTVHACVSGHTGSWEGVAFQGVLFE
jgi:hypothetical protein